MAKTRARFDDAVAQPRSDAYTGMLTLSLIAMIVSCVVLYLDYAQYGSTKAPMPNIPKAAKPNPGINQGAPAEAPAANAGGPLIPVLASLPQPVPVTPAEPAPPAELPASLDGPTLPPPSNPN
jgi:hypothetical protein